MAYQSGNGSEIAMGFLVLLGILAFVCLAFSIYALRKESEITGMYKEFNVYGRIKAYVFTNFSLAFVSMTLGGLVDIFFVHKMPLAELLVLLAVGIVCGAVARYIYLSSQNKCPEGPLKDNLMKNMLISGMGISLKIITLIIIFTAKIVEPRKVVDEKGRELYVFINGDVYDVHGRYVGKELDSNSYLRVRE